MSRFKTLGAALLVMLLWGSLFPMVKVGYAAYGIVTVGDILLFAGVRFTVCGAIICLFAFFKDKASYRPLSGVWFPVLMSGLISIALHYAFSYLGLLWTEASKTAILKQVASLLYISFSFLFFKNEKPTVKKLVAALLGFVGILLINANGQGIHFQLGDVLILAASICLVVANVISKKVFDRISPITATGVSQLFGGVILLAVGAAMGGQMHFDFAKTHVMLYICAASIVSYCLWYTVVKDGELSKLFIIKFAEPVFACLFGAWIFGENILRWQYLVAFALICAGICLASVTRTKKAPVRTDA